MKLYTLITFVVFTLQLQAQTYKGFVEYEIKKNDDNIWYELNYSKTSFHVSIENDTLVIDSIKKTSGDCSLIIDNIGELYGNNLGEWGGELSFKPKGSSNYKKITDGNIVDIFAYKGSVYYTEGLAHLSLNYGGLYKLNKKGNTYKPELLIDFKNEPSAYVFKNDTLYIPSLTSFFVIVNFKVIKEIKDLPWAIAYPNSIVVIDSKHIYLGLRGGYGLLNAETAEYKLYVYTSKQ